jgi:hypothetical protein
MYMSITDFFFAESMVLLTMSGLGVHVNAVPIFPGRDGGKEGRKEGRQGERKEGGGKGDASYW